MSGLVHPAQNVRNATQNSLCRAVNRRRGCCACRASNCRRRARFSRTRSSRERKALTIQPRKCRSDAIIAGIISEKSESSFAPSHSFCRCTRFWRGTGALYLLFLVNQCLKRNSFTISSSAAFSCRGLPSSYGCLDFLRPRHGSQLTMIIRFPRARTCTKWNSAQTWTGCIMCL